MSLASLDELRTQMCLSEEGFNLCLEELRRQREQQETPSPNDLLEFMDLINTDQESLLPAIRTLIAKSSDSIFWAKYVKNLLFSNSKLEDKPGYHHLLALAQALITEN